MKHGHISRNSAKAFFAFVTLALAGACAEQSVAPATEAPAFVAPANFVEVGPAVIFRVNNAEGITKRIGDHLISIPAGSICDLLTSGYGASYWDKPCVPLYGSVVITATVLQDADGNPYIDFQPAMRFSPTKDVLLFMREGRTDGTKRTVVEYCNNLGYCVDESLTDPSLKPFRVGLTSIIGRRVKHFSGYTVNMEEDCPGTATPLPEGGFMCNEGGFQRRSGYMVASGKDILDEMDKNQKHEDEQ